MLKATSAPAAAEETYEQALVVLDRIWPQYDTKGYGIMTIDMEKVLHHVERELGTSLLNQDAWDIFREYAASAQGTIVNQKDLAGLLKLVHDHQLQMQSHMQQQQAQEQPLYDTSLQEYGNDDSHHEPQDLRLQPQQQHDLNDEPYLDESVDHAGSDTSADAPSGVSAATSARTTVTGATSAPLSPLPFRPRTSAPIRRIALQPSSSYPRFRSSVSSNSLAVDADFSPGHYLASPGLDARSTSSGRSPSPIASNHSVEEFEGYGLDAEPDHIDQDDFMRMKMSNADLDRKLKRAQQDYALRLDEQTKESRTHQDEIERLNNVLKTTRKEISELKNTEKSQSSQIQELEQQIQQNEKMSLTQKNGAATLRQQRDELELENQTMQESLRRKEEELEGLVTRLKSLEEESQRITIDQSHMEELQEKLAAEISKNQVMARELEAMQEERKRLKDEVEQLGGSGGINLNLSAVFAAGVDVSTNADQEVKGRSLWSELSDHRKEFIKPLESEPPTPSTAAPPEMPGGWGPEDATRLLQESSQNSAQFATFKKKYEMKRSSIRDMSQLYQDHGKLRQNHDADALVQQDTHSNSPMVSEATSRNSTATVAIATGAEEQHLAEDDPQAFEAQSQKRAVTFGTDDVDCALPDQLPPLGIKMGKLYQENGVTDSLLDDIAKHMNSHSVAPAPAPFQRIHRESVRRRKPHASRAVTQAELDELRGEGMTGATTVQAMGEMVSPASTSTKVARRDTNAKMVANVTLVSMYTIVVYLFGVITSVFLVDSGQNMQYGRFLDAAHQDMAGNGGRTVGFKVVEVLALWIHNLVFQGDRGFQPT